MVKFNAIIESHSLTVGKVLFVKKLLSDILSIDQYSSQLPLVRIGCG